MSSFFPGNLKGRSEAGLQELLRAILVRTNFVPVVRHIIGWRGLKQSAAAVECWTAKIQGAAGVFGLAYDGLEPAPGWSRGRFSLYYFPDAEEELVEQCSLRAAGQTQEPDYLQRVRDFMNHAEFAELFRVGTLILSVDDAGEALGLALEAASRLRCLSEAGVRLPLDGRLVQLIEPGGFDEDFPAYEVAARFFDVLAASVTFNLGHPPACMGEQRWPGSHGLRDQAGSVLNVADPGLWNSRLALGYGLARREDLARPGVPFLQSWTEGAPLPFPDRLWWRAHQVQGATTIDKKTLGVDERPPLILLTGFLGAGKTSFLKHFIEYQTQRSRFVAVIQNEIGAVGLDGKLLDYTVTEIDEGCVCCSLAGNLKHAIQGILKSFNPDCIMVETTGLANPFNLLPDLQELEDLVRFDCTVTVVDALNAEWTLAQHSLAADQIRGADVLMLNKQDLVEPDQLASLTRQVRELNPRAPLFLTVDGDLNPALVFEAADHPPSMAGRAGPEHVTHDRDGLWSHTLRPEWPLERATFLHAVAQLPPSVFRMKGVLTFTDSPAPMLFQSVGGRYDLGPFPGKDEGERFLNVIGHGTKNPDVLARLTAHPASSPPSPPSCV